MAINTGSAFTESTLETAETTVIQATPGEITLPEGFSLASADFAQVGADLVLTAPDGAQVVIRDFFALGELPELVSAEGAHVPGDLAAKLAGPLAPGQVAQAAPGASPEPIGQVENVDGEVVAIRPDGTRVELEVGDPIYQGDVLESGEDGAIGIVFADETAFSMAENGRMVLDEMVYDPGTQEGTIALSIVQGVFTFISGEVAKADPDAMTVSTPVATIGIRGTQMGIAYQEGEELQLVLMEEADGFVGEIVVQNQAGVQILNQANQGVTVASIDEAPSQPETVSPEAIAETYGAALVNMPESSNVNTYGAEEASAVDEELDIETAAGGDEGGDTIDIPDLGLGGEGDDTDLDPLILDFITGTFTTDIGGVIPPPPDPDPLPVDPTPPSLVFAIQSYNAVGTTVTNHLAVLTDDASNDTIDVTLAASHVHTLHNATYVEAKNSSNLVTVNAQDGTNFVNVNLSATGFVSAMDNKTADATVSFKNNDVKIFSDSGNDTINVNMKASAFAKGTISAEAIAYMNRNSSIDSLVTVDAGDGANTVDVTIAAFASASGNLATAFAFNSYNSVDVIGGADTDDISVDLSAITLVADEGYWASGGVADNDIDVDAGDGTNMIDVDLAVTGSANAVTTAAYVTQHIEDNLVLATGGVGADTIDVDLNVTALAVSKYSAYATGSSHTNAIQRNIITVDAFHSADEGVVDAANDLHVGLAYDASAQGSYTDSASATIRSNEVKVYGGSGLDTIDVSVKATGTGNANIVNNKIALFGGDGGGTLALTVTGNNVADNKVFMGGGTGVDTINLTANFSTGNNNLVGLYGGSGADKFNMFGSATGTISFFYNSTSELVGGADTISGLSSGENFTFVFSNLSFATGSFDYYKDTGTGGNGKDTLWYDIVGDSRGAYAVAQFDQDVGITFTGNGQVDVTTPGTQAFIDSVLV